MASATLLGSRCPFVSCTATRPRAVRPQRLLVRAEAQRAVRVATPHLPQLVKPAAAAVVTNLIAAMPAAAEAGKLFDFNATLPIMMGQFLLLMVFLEKFWFTPVGKVLDERDELIRSQLGSVKDNTEELNRLTTEAQEVIRAARAEVTELITKQKRAKQSELDALYATAKDKVNAEIEVSLKAVEVESEALLKALDSQVEKISNEVLKRVLPEGVRI